MTENKTHINPFDPKKFKPKSDLWSQISSGLDDISKQASQDAFSTYKPSPQTWDRVEAGLVAASQSKAHWNSWVYKSIAIVVILILVFWTDTFIIDTPTLLQNTPKIQDQQITPKQTESLPSEKNDAGDIVSPKEENTIQRRELGNLKNKIDKKEKSTGNKKNNTSSIEKKIANQTATPNAVQIRQKAKISIDSNQIKRFLLNPMNMKSINLLSIGNMPVAIENRSAKRIENSIFQKIPKRFWNKIFVGVHYSKELFSGSYSYSDKREAWSTGLDLGYKFGSTFIYSGIDYQNVKDESVFEIDYLKNEVVGSEERVDSIVYQYDAINNVYIRDYVTSDVNLYDSLEYKIEKTPINTYSYLRFPLLLGYKYQRSKLSFTLKAGTEFSLLIKGNEPIPTLNGEEIRILKMVQKSTNNYSSNWQMLMSLGIQYPIYKSLLINAEAHYKSSFTPYFNSKTGVYNKPYTIGFKTGLLINF